MTTFLLVVAVILAVGVDLALGCLALWLAADRHDYRRAAAAGAAAVLLTALLITWAIVTDAQDSGRCGDGTTRVGYTHGKSTDYVCERTPR